MGGGEIVLRRRSDDPTDGNCSDLVAARGRSGVERGTGAPMSAVSWFPPAPARHRGALSARVLGDGAPVVLLHGLVGSGLYWGGAFDRLADRHLLVVPDLLGFGRSPRPANGYTADDHVAAVIACLDEVAAVGPAVVGGHSAGAVLALRLAAAHPERVRAVVAFGPPLYATPDDARGHLAGLGPMARLFTIPGPLAAVACAWVCRHRELAARIAVATHPHLPAPIAADSVEHTWASYTETLLSLILSAEGARWLAEVRCPVRLVAGEQDRVTDIAYLETLGVALDVWPTDHHYPLRLPEACVDLLVAEAERTSSVGERRA